MEIRKIIKTGSSLAVVIPAETVKRMNLKQGDTVAWINGAIVKIAEIRSDENESKNKI